MADLETETRAIGRSLAAAYPARLRTPRRSIEDALVTASGRRPALRAALFRFVDVAPACRSHAQRGEHLVALLEAANAGIPAVTAADRQRLRPLAGRVAARSVRAMASRFIAGADPRSAEGALAELWRSNLAWSVDLLGEATVTAREAEDYAERCGHALEWLSGAVCDWPSRPQLEADSLGVLPRVNLSVKVSALTAEVRGADPQRGIRDALPRMLELARRARDLGAHLHLDMESFDGRDLVMGLLDRLMRAPELKDGPSLGVVLQAYLRDSPEQLDALMDLAASTSRAHPLTVRLVKGAYWDHELVDAVQRGWRSPTYVVKAETDRNFELLARRLIDARARVRTAIASHNLRSVAHALAYNRRVGGKDSDVEIQVLRGLGDDLAVAAAGMGLRARVYAPVGNLIEGMAYLVRRLLENSTNDSFLASRARGADLESLLMAP